MPDRTVYLPPGAVVTNDGYAYPAGYREDCGCGLCRHARLNAEPVPAGSPECYRCDEPTRATDLVETVSGHRICPRCTRYYRYDCDQCHRVTGNITSLGLTWYSTRLCRTCADGSYWECDDCTTLIDSGSYCNDCNRDDDDDGDSDYGCGCPECRRTYGEGGNAAVRYYSYSPIPEFHGDGPLYLGVELEIETEWRTSELEQCARIATAALGDLGYLKSDSSLNNGFEIVTHPMAHAWAAENFPWSMLADLASAGALASDAAGLHVHVSRAGFSSPAHVYKWLQLLYRNSAGVIRIARRDSRQWASFGQPDMRQRIKDHAKGDRYGERYSAVNVQNRDTFEMRVFASTLDVTELRAAMDLAAASIEYTRTLTVADITHRDGWSWGAFERWVGQRPEYTALATQMAGALCAC